MDFQTMSRKVKQKQYKSKAEFSDDLELIWSNCFTYNTGDVRRLLSLRNQMGSETHAPSEACGPILGFRLSLSYRII